MNSFEDIDAKCVNQLNCFEDSMISNCYLTIDVIAKIRQLLIKSRDFGNEEGGFLLGQYKEKKGKYEVLVEMFVVPTEYKYNDRYRIEFGTKAIFELDDVMQANKDKVLVGWLHTHPGHNVFLSSYDINVHSGMFPKPWQFAMVVDTFTEGCNFAMFSRKSNNDMNNSGDLKTYFIYRNY